MRLNTSFRVLSLSFLLITSSLTSLYCTGIFSASDCYAVPRNEFYIQQALDRYFPVPNDARSLATGGATDMTCDDSMCTYLNPAGLGIMRQTEASATIGTERHRGEEVLDDEDFESIDKNLNIEGAFPLGAVDSGRPEYGTLAVSYARYTGTTNDTLNTTPDGHLRTLAYSYAPSDSYSFGYTFVFYDDQLHNDVADLHSHARILHTFGIRHELGDDLVVGGLFKLGVGQSDTEDYTRGSDGLSKPRQYTGAVGITKTRGRSKFSAGVDYTYVRSEGDLTNLSPGVVFGGDEEGNFYDIRTGFEHDYDSGFIARAGLRWYDITQYDFHRKDVRDLSGDYDSVGFSLGAGYEFKRSDSSLRRVRIDYGVEYATALDGDWEHKISVVVPF